MTNGEDKSRETNEIIGALARAIVERGHVAEIHPAKDGGVKIFEVTRKLKGRVDDDINGATGN